jgi:HPt (histidine-containing phosphotransfer) domain-containing protein
MAPKLSSRQQAQLAYLQLVPQKLQRIYSVIEQLASPRVDEALMRGLGRLLDDIKGNAASLSMAGLAETAGRMGMLVRSGGKIPTKVRGLRELQGSLKINYDAALRAATTPEGLGEEEPSGSSPPV